MKWYRRWSTYVIFGWVLIGSMLGDQLLHWTFPLPQGITFISGIALGVVFLSIEDRIRFRAKVMKIVRVHPEAETFDFEYEGRRYRGFITTIQPESQAGQSKGASDGCTIR